MGLPFEFDMNRGPAVGVVVLQTDELIELELGKLFLPMGIRVYQNRIPSMEEVRPETLATMAESMTGTAAMIPKETGINVIGYGCTSGATVMGEDRVRDLVNAAHPDVAVTNPLSALKAACKALGIKRLGLVTPYVLEVNQALIEALKLTGIEVTEYGSFEQVEDQSVARISANSTLNAILDIGAGDCDAVFASCTNLRAMEIIDEAEAKLDKPVLCSNQVLGWHMLRLGGSDEKPTGYGRLFNQPLDG